MDKPWALLPLMAFTLENRRENRGDNDRRKLSLPFKLVRRDLLLLTDPSEASEITLLVGMSKGSVVTTDEAMLLANFEVKLFLMADPGTLIRFRFLFNYFRSFSTWLTHLFSASWVWVWCSNQRVTLKKSGLIWHNFERSWWGRNQSWPNQMMPTRPRSVNWHWIMFRKPMPMATKTLLYSNQAPPEATATTEDNDGYGWI